MHALLLAAAITSLGDHALAQSQARRPQSPRPDASRQTDREPSLASRGVYYPNCDAARAAGAAPIRAGQPGYRAGLDRDGDGIACEPYRGR